MNDIEQLAQDLFDAKRAEDNAKAKRIAIEEQIASLVETPDNGSKTVSAGDFKLTVKRSLSYKADVDGLAKSGFKDLLVTVPKTFELDEKSYESLRATDPHRFALAAAFVTVKPKKVSVTLKI